MANQKITTEQLQKEIDHKSSQCVEIKECLGNCMIYFIVFVDLSLLLVQTQWKKNCRVQNRRMKVKPHS